MDANEDSVEPEEAKESGRVLAYLFVCQVLRPEVEWGKARNQL